MRFSFASFGVNVIRIYSQSGIHPPTRISLLRRNRRNRTTFSAHVHFRTSKAAAGQVLVSQIQQEASPFLCNQRDTFCSGLEKVLQWEERSAISPEYSATHSGIARRSRRTKSRCEH